jgi:cell division protein FtsI (penicillin-binding protein 3)
VYTGNLVAGPIFKEVADKVFANSLQMHKELDERPFMASSSIPYSLNGSRDELYQVFTALGVPVTGFPEKSEWMKTSTKDSVVVTDALELIPGLVPDVVGMGLKDAVYVLENSGLTIQFTGKGVVKKQSILPGKRIVRGQTIKIELT